MTESPPITPCPLCAHPHGEPFDFCRWPKDWHEGDPVPTEPYEACGCRG